MRKVLALTLAAALAAFAATFAPATGAAGARADATVTTDKTDYQPGETVVIFGSGWAGGEAVRLVVHADSGARADAVLSAEADELGNILNKEFSPAAEDLGASFTLTATGAASGRTASARFTDGGNMTYSPNSTTLAAFSGTGGSTTAGFAQTVTAPSGNGNFQAPAAVTPLSLSGSTPMPASWVSVSGGAGNFVTGPAQNPKNPPDFKVRSVSVTPAANSAPGTYTAVVTAVPSIGGVSTGQGTLVTLTVTADNAPPNTVATAADSNGNPYGGAGFTNATKVTVTLTATDGDSGVQLTRYRVDNAPLQNYSGPFDIAAEGISVVTYFSVDKVGAQETPHFFTVKIDKTRPVITLNGAAEMTLPYGSTFTDPGATATDAGGSGLAGPVVATGAVNTDLVGDYLVSYNVSDNAGNAADAVTRTVHVVRADQTISFGPLADKTYGDPDFALSATAGSGDPVSFSAAGNCTVGGATLHITGAGSCTVTASEDGNANYNAAPDVLQSFNIARADAAINVTPYHVTYDGHAHTATGTAAGVNGEDLSSLLDLSATTHTNAGGYPSDAWSFAGDGNYNSASGTAGDHIDKADAAVSVSGVTVTYDGHAHGASGTATGVLGESLSALLHLGSSFTNVPGGTADWNFDGDDNYNAAAGSAAVHINPAPLTVTASSPAAVTYGDAAPAVAPAYSGFVAGEGPSNLSAHPTCGTVYAAGSDAGTYPTTCSGAAAANYQISYVAGSLNVNKKLLTVKADDKSKFYDGTPYSPFTVSYAGFVLGQNQSVLGGALTFSGSAVGATLVGTYAITPGGLASNNYSFNYVGGALTINAWTLRGFYSPVQMSLGAVVWNNIKGGQTVPLKFNLYAGTEEKTSTAAVRGFTVTQVACTAGLDVQDDPNGLLPTTGGTALRYSGTPGLDGQFVQNWATPGTSGRCYKVTMTALDYSTLSAFFKTR